MTVNTTADTANQTQPAIHSDCGIHNGVSRVVFAVELFLRDFSNTGQTRYEMTSAVAAKHNNATASNHDLKGAVQRALSKSILTWARPECVAHAPAGGYGHGIAG